MLVRPPSLLVGLLLLFVFSRFWNAIELSIYFVRFFFFYWRLGAAVAFPLSAARSSFDFVGCSFFLLASLSALSDWATLPFGY